MIPDQTQRDRVLEQVKLAQEGLGGLPDLPKKTELVEPKVELDIEEPELDESEYEVIQGSDKKEPSETSSSKKVDSKKVRKVSAKTLVKGANKGQLLLSTITFDYFSDVKQAITLKKGLRSKALKGKLTELEQRQMAAADQFIEDYEAEKRGFSLLATLSEEDENDLIDCVEELMNAYQVETSPWWGILMILVIAISYNIYMAYSSRKTFIIPQ